MKAQINLTEGNWNAEILNALRFAFDPAKVGYTVTLEKPIGYPIRIFGLAKNDGTSIPVYIEGCQSTILVQPDDLVFLNHS